jgi:hypothetical protein
VRLDRALALAVALALPGGVARAQLDAPPEPVLEPSPAPQTPPPVPPPIVAPLPRPEPRQPARQPYSATVHGRSPDWTQDRSFTSTRFWLLDPGRYEVQTWFRTRIQHEIDGTRGPAEFLLQQEIEIGLVPHLQLDLYENVTFNVDDSGKRGVQQEGVQIEARIAIPRYYGQIPLNPVIYLEWHPRHNNPDRAEVRLLLGGAPTRWLYLVANPYFETNVEETDVYEPGVTPTGAPVKHSKFIADAEVGTTLAAGFRITDWFRLSLEMKIGGDMLGDEKNDFHFVWFAGPGMILKPFHNNYFKIMATCLFALPGTDENAQQFEPLVILGSAF